MLFNSGQDTCYFCINIFYFAIETNTKMLYMVSLTMVVYCWASDAGPTINRHRFNATCAGNDILQPHLN